MTFGVGFPKFHDVQVDVAVGWGSVRVRRDLVRLMSIRGRRLAGRLVVSGVARRAKTEGCSGESLNDIQGVQND